MVEEVFISILKKWEFKYCTVFNLHVPLRVSVLCLSNPLAPFVSLSSSSENTNSSTLDLFLGGCWWFVHSWWYWCFNRWWWQAPRWFSKDLFFGGHWWSVASWWWWRFNRWWWYASWWSFGQFWSLNSHCHYGIRRRVIMAGHRLMQPMEFLHLLALEHRQSQLLRTHWWWQREGCLFHPLTHGLVGCDEY